MGYCYSPNEKKDPVSRDLMIHCWCSKKDNDIIRNTIAHPDTTKKDAQDLLTQDKKEKKNSAPALFVSDAN